MRMEHFTKILTVPQYGSLVLPVAKQLDASPNMTWYTNLVTNYYLYIYINMTALVEDDSKLNKENN